MFFRVGCAFDATVEPHVCLHVVLRNALAMRIHDPETELSFGVILLGREAKPLACFGGVLREPTCVIHMSEIILSFGVALVGREPKPLWRLNPQLIDHLLLPFSCLVRPPPDTVKQDPELRLSFDVTLFCREAQPMQCFAEVPTTLVVAVGAGRICLVRRI